MAAEKPDPGMSPDAHNQSDSEANGTPVTWRVTRDVEQRDLRCDLCGEQADTVHIIPNVTKAEKAVFACDDHCPEPQGYMIGLSDYYERTEHWLDHLAEKRDGDFAGAVLVDRIRNVQFDLVDKDRTNGMDPLGVSDPARWEQSIYSGFLDIMDASGQYPATRAAVLKAIEAGTRDAMTEHLARLGTEETD